MEFQFEIDEEWNVVWNVVVMLVELGNLLMIGSWVWDQNDWIVWFRDLIVVGEMVMCVVEVQDLERFFEVGVEIYCVCDGCYLQYWVGQFQFDDGCVVVEVEEVFGVEESD